MAVTADKFIVKLQNSNVNAGNYQIVDFDRDSFSGRTIWSDDLTWAAIVVYLGIVSGCMAAGTTIAGIQWREAGSPGGVDLPWDQAAFDTIQDVGTGLGYTVPNATSYSTSMGDGGLAPLGTSISMSELTATAGRIGRGRHFLPFIGENSVSAGGSVGTGVIALNEGAATDILIGSGTTGGDDNPGIGWCVTGPVSEVSKLITSVKCQPIYSNLESRRR